MPPPIQNFEGVARLDVVTGGQAGTGFPPDTNGEVGLNHYIISVNAAYVIYDKATGTQVAAFTENSLFSGGPTGTLCDTNSFGDPVVVYDQLANRWILTNFAFVSFPGPGPFYQCFAVSQTSDPVAGGWFLYAVRIDQGAVTPGTLPDYGKFGHWNDGCLYMGANAFGAMQWCHLRQLQQKRYVQRSSSHGRGGLLDGFRFFFVSHESSRDATRANAATRNAELFRSQRQFNHFSSADIYSRPELWRGRHNERGHHGEPRFGTLA